jgi:hypothetical protein
MGSTATATRGHSVGGKATFFISHGGGGWVGELVVR